MLLGRRSSLVWAGFCAAVLSSTLSRPGWAVGEEEWQLSALAGYTQLAQEGRRPGGVGGGLEGHYGVTDAWALRATAIATWHPVSASVGRPAGGVRASGLALGATYSLDALRLVPFADIGIALADIRGAVAASRQDLGFEVGVGAEYLIARRWAVAALARYQYFPVGLSDITSAWTTRPGLFFLGLRLGAIFW